MTRAYAGHLTVEQRVFYIEQALSALDEAVAYAACAAQVIQVHQINVTRRSLREACDKLRESVNAENRADNTEAGSGVHQPASPAP